MKKSKKNCSQLLSHWNSTQTEFKNILKVKKLITSLPFIGTALGVLYLLLVAADYNLPLFPHSGLGSFILLNLILIPFLGACVGMFIEILIEKT